jgi:N-acetylglucosamine kinase-like BadF-type ATPase
MVCAWAGSLAVEDGINIVAGTGWIGSGERRGKAARAGGWGEVFGDEGSAYWIAVQGLNVFTRMSDGRLPKDALYALFRDSFRLGDDLDLCARVLNNHSRDSVAAVAQLVTRAAQEGDAAAIRIFDSAANELAAVADAVRLALDFAADEIVPVSYSGGVFHAGALILDPFAHYLAQRCTRFELRAPVLPPSIGAAIYAAKLAGSPFSSAALRRLHDASASAG